MFSSAAFCASFVLSHLSNIEAWHTSPRQWHGGCRRSSPKHPSVGRCITALRRLRQQRAKLENVRPKPSPDPVAGESSCRTMRRRRRSASRRKGLRGGPSVCRSQGVQRSVARAEGLKELEGFKAYKTAERLGKLSEETGELGQSVAVPRQISSRRIRRKPWTT